MGGIELGGTWGDAIKMPAADEETQEALLTRLFRLSREAWGIRVFFARLGGQSRMW